MMNRLIIVLTCLWAMPGVCAGTASPDEKDFQYAQMHGAEAMFVLKVVDDRDEVVPGADVRVGLTLLYGDGGAYHLSGQTDQRGEFVVRGRTIGPVTIVVSKDNYYMTRTGYDLSKTDTRPRVVGGRWQPYEKKRTLVLKRIRRPVALCQPRGMPVRGRSIPAFDTWLDMDCETFDWLPPHGKGRFKDMQVKFSRVIRRKHFDFRVEMEVSFTNNAHGGIHLLPKDMSSDLLGPYHAETNWNYSASYSYLCDESPERKESSGSFDESCFIFRTRTKVDAEGRLESAHYGYIIGPWCMGDTKMIVGDVRFNPVPNDTNLEDEEGARRAWSNLRIFREHQGKK